MPAGDVGTNWFIIELTSEPVVNYVELPDMSLSAQSGFEADIPDLHAPVVDPTQGGGGRGFWYGAGGPAFERLGIVINGEATLYRTTTLVIPASVELQRSRSATFSANMELQRKRSIHFQMEREPAHHYLQLVREDDELLMLI
jgi:hypothetical protein